MGVCVSTLSGNRTSKTYKSECAFDAIGNGGQYQKARQVHAGTERHGHEASAGYSRETQRRTDGHGTGGPDQTEPAFQCNHADSSKSATQNAVYCQSDPTVRSDRLILG